jgi:hypothetical protein
MRLQAIVLDLINAFVPHCRSDSSGGYFWQKLFLFAD